MFGRAARQQKRLATRAFQLKRDRLEAGNSRALPINKGVADRH
jgi:hypothetical protein